MGIFKNVGKIVGKGIEIFGNITGIEIIEDLGKNIQYACEEVSESTGITDSYDKETARVDETKRINEILSEFSLNLQKRADQIESKAINESNVYFKILLEELPKTSIEINDSSIKRSILKVERSITGNLKNYISKKVSIDDKECLEILKLDAGFNKKNKMQKFSEKILKQGLENLTDDIRSVIKEQEKILSDSIQDNINNIQSNLNKQMQELKIVEDSKLKSEEELNNIKVQLNEKIKLSKACLNFLA